MGMPRNNTGLSAFLGNNNVAPSVDLSGMAGWGMGQNPSMAIPTPDITPTVAMPWAKAPPVMPWANAESPAMNPYSGTPDYQSTLQNPAMAGLDFNTGTGSGGTAGSGLFDGFLGKTENGVTSQGWGGMALGTAQGLMNGYMGLKQYGLAKDTFNENKRQFGLNYDAQQKTTNAHLADRQAARVAGSTSGYQSVADYMKTNGI